jgi:GNAT superfamily N-acetyltransferase
MRYTIRPLDVSTWAAFADLVERNNGIFGGCWCMGYHPEMSRTHAAHNRAGKQRRVWEGRAQAALVVDEDGSAQGWCQYGSPEELPGIKHKREYQKAARAPPDWRITCLYVDKKHRGQGRARALEGALDQIAHHDGGHVEAISEVTPGREAQGRFLCSATVELPRTFWAAADAALRTEGALTEVNDEIEAAVHRERQDAAPPGYPVPALAGRQQRFRWIPGPFARSARRYQRCWRLRFQQPILAVRPDGGIGACAGVVPRPVPRS